MLKVTVPNSNLHTPKPPFSNHRRHLPFLHRRRIPPLLRASSFKFSFLPLESPSTLHVTTVSYPNLCPPACRSTHLRKLSFSCEGNPSHLHFLFRDWHHSSPARTIAISLATITPHHYHHISATTATISLNSLNPCPLSKTTTAKTSSPTAMSCFCKTTPLQLP